MDSTLIKQWQSISQGESDFMVNCSQLCALLMQNITDLSWCGFYWDRDEMLVVGAYQGPLACTRIEYQDGVCGKAFATVKTQIVADVNQFKGHIACDSNSASEIVVPLLKDGKVIGVFDIDSYILNRFDSEFAVVLEEILTIFMDNTEIPNFHKA